MEAKLGELPSRGILECRTKPTTNLNHHCKSRNLHTARCVQAMVSTDEL